MKRLSYLVLLMVLFSGCGINQQLNQIKALEKCKYQLLSADSVYIANTEISRLVNKGSFDLGSAPRLALALLQQNVPLKARLNLQIKNPGGEQAGINQFEYRILIKDQELFNGRIDQKVSIDPKQVTTVPIRIDQNIYPLVANAKNRRALAEFLTADAEKSAVITLKIKPTLDIGNKAVQYPGYITIDKKITNTMLFDTLSDVGR